MMLMFASSCAAVLVSRSAKKRAHVVRRVGFIKLVVFLALLVVGVVVFVGIKFAEADDESYNY